VASPTVQTAAGATGNSATPTITEPASAAQDDLLIAVVGSSDPATAITGLTGWTQLAEGDDTQGNRYWYGWIIRGASAPDLVAAAANTNWCTHCVRITGHDDTTPIAGSANANGSGAAPDSPNVDPGSSDDYLSVAAFIQEGKGATRSSPPSTPGTYTEQTDAGTSGAGAGTTHVGGSIATRQYTSQAENPGTFTSTVTDGWLALTIIVQQPQSAPQTIAVNEPTETEAAQAVAVLSPITIAVDEPTETETAQAIAILSPITVAVVAAVETEVAQVVVGTVAQTIAVNEAIETEAGQVVSFTRSLVAARPDADNDKAGWDSAPTGGQDLYLQIDEVAADDADYMFVELTVQS
jgi:hypothetical protein